MSTNFSFNTTAGASQSTAVPKLEGNEIHKVKFESCEIVDITGKKDPTATYKLIRFRYSNEDGYYEHAIFEPQNTPSRNDFVRGETEFTNKQGNVEKIPQPSGVESMMLFFKHNIDAFVPKLGLAIDKGEQNLSAPNWDGLRKLVKQIMDKGVGVESHIKLLNDNKGEARFPGFFTGINRDGKAYVRNNFIGDKLSFSSYETSRMKNEASAKPTDMSKLKTPILDTPDDDLDLNFDIANL